MIGMHGKQADGRRLCRLVVGLIDKVFDSKQRAPEPCIGMSGCLDSSLRVDVFEERYAFADDAERCVTACEDQRNDGTHMAL